MAALLGAQLVATLARAQAVNGNLRYLLRPWLIGLEEASAALATGAVTPAQWQGEIHRLLSRVDLADLLRAIDFEKLAAQARFPDQAEGLTRLYFPDADGRIHPLHFRPFLFALKKDVAVVPHGHHNMATMHMVLQGRAHVRHFDRVADDATHMVIRPATDAVVEPGHVSSVSDEQHNIHWFRALTQPVFMFNIGVYQVNAGQPFGERDYVDAGNGTPVGNGLLRAARLDRQAAYARYGRAS
jgi:hypothetical protein